MSLHLMAFVLALLATRWSLSSALVTVPATQYMGESADLGSYFVEISIGRPHQRIRAQVDTGSGYVVVPAKREDCAGCTAAGGRTYDRSMSSTMRIVPCHSRECLHVEGTENADGAPTICAIQIGDTQICPRSEVAGQTAGAEGAFGGRMAPEGAGQCLLDPTIVPGPTIGCNDHLELASGDGSPTSGSEACATVLQRGLYNCETLMSTFNSDLKGTLKDVCSETCGQCSEGPVRFCDDNQHWLDEESEGCAAYRSGQPKHSHCFAGSGAASVACPIACDSCGDCCARPVSAPASAEPECYFFMHYVDGTIVSGTKLKEEVDLQPGPGTAARLVNQVKNAAVGVFSHVDSQWTPSGDVDGVLGLSSGVTCNPSCEPSFLDQFWSSNPWMPKVFALCLSTVSNVDGTQRANGAVDLGGVVAEHYHEPLVWLDLLLERQLMGDMGYTIDAPVLDVQIGGISIIDKARAAEEQSTWLTSAELASYAVSVDSGVTGILLPLRLFVAVAALFTRITPTFNAQNPLHGKRNTSLLWPNLGRPDSVCGGPVTADYRPSTDFHSIRLVLGGGTGGPNFTIALAASDYLIKNPTPEVSRIQLPNGGEFTLELAGGQQYLCNSIGVSPVSTMSESGRREKIVLGGTFLQQYYAAFDMGRGRVGIAKAADCAHPGPAPPPPCEVPNPQHGGLGSCPKADEGAAGDTARVVPGGDESGWLPGGASCEISCDDGYHPVGHLTADASSLSSAAFIAASQSYSEAPQFAICGMDGNLIGVTTCEADVEACGSAPCTHGGSCIGHNTYHYECNCAHGYLGTNCEVEEPPPPSPLPAPPPSPCSPHGETSTPRADQSYSCTCDEGWGGDNCDVQQNEQPVAPTPNQDQPAPPISSLQPGNTELDPGAEGEVIMSHTSERSNGQDGSNGERVETENATTPLKAVMAIVFTACCCWYHQNNTGARGIASQGRGGDKKGGAYKLVPQRDSHLA